MPVVGFLNAGTAEAKSCGSLGFEDGLKQNGYTAGENVTLEYRFRPRTVRPLSGIRD